jgi:hypothetical protein
MSRLTRVCLSLPILAVAAELLARALDAWGFGGKLLSMGTHTPLWALAGGALLVGLRVLLFVVGPGLVAAAVVAALARRLRPTEAVAGGHGAGGGLAWRR